MKKVWKLLVAAGLAVTFLVAGAGIVSSQHSQDVAMIIEPDYKQIK